LPDLLPEIIEKALHKVVLALVGDGGFGQNRSSTSIRPAAPSRTSACRSEAPSREHRSPE
jgi:hypothetical protein